MESGGWGVGGLYQACIDQLHVIFLTVLKGSSPPLSHLYTLYRVLLLCVLSCVLFSRLFFICVFFSFAIRVLCSGVQ